MISITVQFHQERAVYSYHFNPSPVWRAVIQAVCFALETVVRHWYVLRAVVAGSREVAG
jgi:hypothetical protein